MILKRAFLMLSIVVCTVGAVSAQTEWVDYPVNPVLPPGNPGEWDEGGRSPGTVIWDGSNYHMWFGGFSSENPPLEQGIGHATSPDGVDWTMDGNNPVLEDGEPGQWDDWLWFPSPAVTYDGMQFHMWYSGTPSLSANPIQAGYATSPNGSVWTKYPGNPVMEVGSPGAWDDVHVRPGAVIFDGATYTMWYSGYDGSTVLIGEAESSDGIHWTKHPDNPVLRGGGSLAWDTRVANPSVVFTRSVYNMWYVGWAASVGDWMLGYAFSNDGIHWWRSPENPVITKPGNDLANMPVDFDGEIWRGWYTQRPASNPTGWLGYYSTSTCCAGIFGDGFETGDTAAWSNTVP